MGEEPGDEEPEPSDPDSAGADTQGSADSNANDPDPEDEGSDDLDGDRSDDARTGDDEAESDNADATESTAETEGDGAAEGDTDVEDGGETAEDDAGIEGEDDELGNLNEAWGLSGEDHATPPATPHDDLDDEEVPSPEEMRPETADDAAASGPPTVSDVPADEPTEYEPPDPQTTSAPTDGGYADEADPKLYEDFDPTDEPIHEGAPDDQEMPLADHIEEMVRRLGVVILVMAIVSAITFPFGADLINFLWFSYLPGSIEACPEAASKAVRISQGQGGSACPRVYHPLALVLARLKVATLAGFVVALPVFVYETYLFMRPGLYPHERRYYLASVPTSLILAAIGVLFAHLLVLPALFTYFLYYSDDAAVIAFGLSETFDLITLLLGGFAFIFQIPLFVMLALMMGLVTRRWMTERRLLFWGGFAGLAFLFSPDPTGMAPIIVAATMIVLFEGTLLLARWTGRG